MNHWTEEKTNLPQSILAQLRNHAREVGEDPQVIQRRYATERLMYRIAKSEYADRFVLKGAWLFFLWGDPQRATRDVDFAGAGVLARTAPPPAVPPEEAPRGGWGVWW